MPAALLMLLSTLLFSTMSVTVKLASAIYGTGEIVFYRGLVGAAMIGVIARCSRTSLRTAVPGMHVARGVSGVCALMLWFYAIGNLPLATAVTLNYMSSIWMTMFLLGGAVLLGSARVDPRLVFTVLLGFAGVALVLRPTIEHNQLWHGLAGLLSGMLAALAYLQVTALGRAGEPELRVVFHFSLFTVAGGAAVAAFGGWHAHTPAGVLWLIATGVLATLAQLLLTRAYAIGRPLVNASLQYMGIVFSFGYGMWLFDDPVTSMALTGMTFIVAAGLAATMLRRKAVAAAPVDSSQA